MKRRLCCLTFLLSVLNFCKAQDSTVVLDISKFDTNSQTISLTRFNGWIFKQGNDTNWAKNEIDTTGWIKLNPIILTAKNADKNGKLEGWCRIRFKLDSSFENMQIGIQGLRWAATDIYIDGNYIASFGNTGLNGKPYEENRNVGTAIQPLKIETGKEHLLAVHIVDYVAPLNHRFLKTGSLFNNFSSLIVITGPLANEKFISYIRDLNGYGFLFCGVIGFLAVLFWFLYLQNRREKSILFIAISTSFFFTWALLITLSYYPFDINFNRWWLIFFIGLQFWPLAIVSMIYTVGEIFHFKYKKALLIFGILYVGYSVVNFYFDIIPFGAESPIIIIIALYIPLSLRKRLKGAQWAVVAGVISTVIFSFTWAYLATYYYKSYVFPHVYLYLSGEYLSFPASLMIYVAMRFKEILTEVQVNAKQVIQLSEEKKEQAVRQQRILEEEVTRQTIELRTSLENLKSTQSQLIQSEKMASLGELTAGIAHEIQNPLNFVNNFSDVNKELIEELNAERRKPKAVRDEQLENEILNDLKENEEKINHHGKRADAIVKGMLQHSRQSSGQKEPTDINAMCDEYLRLSYHGMRARDKEFNAEIKTDFDDKIGKINIIPQDIGRVLLNLFNNAFYAVNEQKIKNPDLYEPTVLVTTKKSDNHVIITVSDNGNGIPKNIIDKIFQPFFTTKPAGSGTGLGLSLSYDIIKAHGGEIKVKSKKGEGRPDEPVGPGSEFIIQLPI